MILEIGRIALVFFALMILDFVWARYNQATASHHPLSAANYAVAIILLGGFSVTQYVSDPWMLIPAALGAWCGTYLATKGGA